MPGQGRGWPPGSWEGNTGGFLLIALQRFSKGRWASIPAKQQEREAGGGPGVWPVTCPRMNVLAQGHPDPWQLQWKGSFSGNACPPVRLGVSVSGASVSRFRFGFILICTPLQREGGAWNLLGTCMCVELGHLGLRRVEVM